jgi:hypothetical protein
MQHFRGHLHIIGFLLLALARADSKIQWVRGSVHWLREALCLLDVTMPSASPVGRQDEGQQMRMDTAVGARALSHVAAREFVFQSRRDPPLGP